MVPTSYGHRAIDIATSTGLQFAIKLAAGHRDVMIILTDDYTKSEWCLKELACAKEVGTPVLPLSTEHVWLNEELQVYLDTRQIVPFEPAITAVNKSTPRKITYDYDVEAY